MQNEINAWVKKYPYMKLGVGLYSLDGSKGYLYNVNKAINSASTIKAAYALFVLNACEERGIIPSETYITFESRHDHTGSGTIMYNGRHGDKYSIEYLIKVLLGVSDNVAYEMLKDKFSIKDFSAFNKALGGQSDGMQWGSASVNQRKNEWVAIYKYITGGRLYSELLRSSLTGTQYSFIAEGMTGAHTYMYKSGWTYTTTYPSHNDCAIVDESYLLIILTQDATTTAGRKDAILGIARAVEKFVEDSGGEIFSQQISEIEG